MILELRQTLARLIALATSGGIRADEALAGGSLRALGLDSLAALRLIDAIDLEFGVEVEVGGILGPDTLDDIARSVEAKL
jgi:acyl carrier protein